MISSENDWHHVMSSHLELNKNGINAGELNASICPSFPHCEHIVTSSLTLFKDAFLPQHDGLYHPTMDHDKLFCSYIIL